MEQNFMGETTVFSKGFEILASSLASAAPLRYPKATPHHLAY
jgi:hypothetical protein